MSLCLCMCACLYVFVFACVRLYACVCVHVCVCVYLQVRKYIQAERDVCQCETKQPVYRVIKFYQRYLRQSQQDSMAKASVWKSTEVYTSNTRALVLEVIAKLLAGGAHLNYTTGTGVMPRWPSV